MRHGRPRHRQDLVAPTETRLPLFRRGIELGERRAGRNAHALVVQHAGENDDGEKKVRDGTGGDHGQTRQQRLVAEVAVLRDLGVGHVVGSVEELFAATRRFRRVLFRVGRGSRAVGIPTRFCRGYGSTALLADTVAGHLHVAAHRNRRQRVLRLTPPELEQLRPETHRERLDVDARELGDDEVPKLVKHDDGAQNDGECEKRGQHGGSPVGHVASMNRCARARAWASAACNASRSRRTGAAAPAVSSSKTVPNSSQMSR